MVLGDFVRTLVGLPSVELRAQWLRDRFERLGVEPSATLLEQLLHAGVATRGEAREALHAVVVHIVGNVEDPFFESLREAAKRAHLLALQRLLRRGPPPEQVERPWSELPVPDYGRGRELTVGERRSLARRPTKSALDRLVVDPHPLVIHQLMGTPRLTEDNVVRMVARRPARLEVLREVARWPRWIGSARVRLSMICNPGTPTALSVPLLHLCHRGELRQILQAVDTLPVLRATANELLERMPPLSVEEARGIQ